MSAPDFTRMLDAELRILASCPDADLRIGAKTELTRRHRDNPAFQRMLDTANGGTKRRGPGMTLKGRTATFSPDAVKRRG